MKKTFLSASFLILLLSSCQKNDNNKNYEEFVPLFWTNSTEKIDRNAMHTLFNDPDTYPTPHHTTTGPYCDPPAGNCIPEITIYPSKLSELTDIINQIKNGDNTSDLSYFIENKDLLENYFAKDDILNVLNSKNFVRVNSSSSIYNYVVFEKTSNREVVTAYEFKK